MNDVFFTADTHFGHTNIIKYCNRPFDSPESMEEAMIDRFNSIIKKGDRLYHLGDMAWSTYKWDRFLGRLNTKSVHFITGNHDPDKRVHHASIQSWQNFLSWHSPDKGVGAVLFHYPMLSWHTKSHGGYHLFGHVHGRLQGVDRSMDVGVDTNNFFPYSWEEIHGKLKDKPFYGQEGKD